jgi:hypothetical protein
MQIFTQTLNNGDTFLVTASLTVSQLSLVANPSSEGTILGDFTIGGVTSTPVTLSAGQGITLTSTSPQSPLQGITIECTSGSMDLVLAVS